MRILRRIVTICILIPALSVTSFAATSVQSTSRASITLLYNKHSFVYHDDIITPTNHLVAEEIHNRKINANFCQKMRAVNICLYAGADYKTALLYSFPLLEKTVDLAIKRINCPPRDSKITFSPNKKQMFSIDKQKNGARVEEMDLYKSIYSALCSSKEIKVRINPTILSPKITAEDNAKLTFLRSRFTTYYGASGLARKHNIELALKRINGSTIEPHGEFSFNKTVGKRSLENGFKNAIIIKRGEYVEGVGGGVCQASTTLYNCALLGDMEIKSVRNHSLEPSYVWPSFDAMVSSSTDLVFCNNGSMPVFLKAYSDNGNAVVEMYGSRLPYTIIRRSEEVQREQPPADNIVIDTQFRYLKKEDEPGKQKRVWYSKGQLKSVGYLLYYDSNGILINKKQIRKDTYNRTNGLIAVRPPIEEGNS